MREILAVVISCFALIVVIVDYFKVSRVQRDLVKLANAIMDMINDIERENDDVR